MGISAIFKVCFGKKKSKKSPGPAWAKAYPPKERAPSETLPPKPAPTETLPTTEPDPAEDQHKDWLSDDFSLNAPVEPIRKTNRYPDLESADKSKPDSDPRNYSKPNQYESEPYRYKSGGYYAARSNTSTSPRSGNVTWATMNMATYSGGDSGYSGGGDGGCSSGGDGGCSSGGDGGGDGGGGGGGGGGCD